MLVEPNLAKGSIVTSNHADHAATALHGWDQMFAEVRAVIDSNGVIARGSDDEETARALRKWCAHQRSRRLANRLREDRIAALESLAGWSWDSHEASWNRQCQEVIEHVEKDGCFPTRGSNDEAERLAGWCTNQRRYASEGSLSEGRLARLLLIPGWESFSSDSSRARFGWDEKFGKIVAYVNEHSRFPSATQGNDADVIVLGQWCAGQRTRRRNGELSTELSQLLESIPGWQWEPFASRWDQSYASVRSFVQERGVFPNPKADDQAVRKLGVWCHNQYASLRNGTMPAHRVELWAQLIAMKNAHRSSD